MQQIQDKPKDKTLHISPSVHKELSSHLGKKIKMAAFVEEAILEKIQKEKSKTK